MHMPSGQPVSRLCSIGPSKALQRYRAHQLMEQTALPVCVLGSGTSLINPCQSTCCNVGFLIQAFSRLRDNALESSKLLTAVIHFQKLAVSKAFAAWAEWAPGRQQHRVKLQIAAQRWVSLALSSAFSAWRDVAAHAASQKRQVT